MHLDDASLSKIRGILRRHLPAGVDVLVFGSRAHGRNLKPFSDLDLCLRGKQPVPVPVLEGLDAAFRESDLPIKVDIIDWHCGAPEFRDAIAPDLVPLLLQADSGIPNPDEV
jgi:predicted nucleotidyltransferase